MLGAGETRASWSLVHSLRSEWSDLRVLESGRLTMVAGGWTNARVLEASSCPWFPHPSSPPPPPPAGPGSKGMLTSRTSRTQPFLAYISRTSGLLRCPSGELKESGARASSTAALRVVFQESARSSGSQPSICAVNGEGEGRR